MRKVQDKVMRKLTIRFRMLMLMLMKTLTSVRVTVICLRNQTGQHWKRMLPRQVQALNLKKMTNMRRSLEIMSGDNIILLLV